VEIRAFAERMCKEFANTKIEFEAANTNAKFKTVLQTAMETCGAMTTHGIIFAALSAHNASSEHDVQTRLHDLRNIVLINKSTVDRAGLTKLFLERFGEEKRRPLAFQHSVEHLQSLNEKQSPLDKLWSLRDASRALRDLPGNDNMDDALPLFLLALITAAPGLLLANLQFMSDFAPRLWVKSAGELAFHCTVFSGAVSLIQEHMPALQEEETLLRNLIVAGGSGLGVNWVGGAVGTRSYNSGRSSSTKKGLTSSSSSLAGFKLFESCTPQSRS
jgi:hypothetical protein